MAHNKHYVIYVPGIRDDLLFVQSLLIQFWRLQGVRPIRLSMPWRGQGQFENKLAKLIHRIDKYQQQGHQVSLVGASAGASAILNAYAQRKDSVVSLAYICGKINDPDTVSNKTYLHNPAFKTSMLLLQNVVASLDNTDKNKLTSFFSTADRTVPYEDTIINGVAEQKLPAVGHSLAILYALSFGSRKLLGVLKR